MSTTEPSAPALPTAPAENPTAPKVHRLAPIHLHVLNEASAQARGVMAKAERLVAESLGVSGPFRLEDLPGGPALVEQGP